MIAGSPDPDEVPDLDALIATSWRRHVHAVQAGRLRRALGWFQLWTRYVALKREQAAAPPPVEAAPPPPDAPPPPNSAPSTPMTPAFECHSAAGPLQPADPVRPP
jgi:hypothetical protein